MRECRSSIHVDQECFKCSVSGGKPAGLPPPDDMWFCGVTSHFLSDMLHRSTKYTAAACDDERYAAFLTFEHLPEPSLSPTGPDQGLGLQCCHSNHFKLIFQPCKLYSFAECHSVQSPRCL